MKNNRTLGDDEIITKAAKAGDIVIARTRTSF